MSRTEGSTQSHRSRRSRRKRPSPHIIKLQRAEDLRSGDRQSRDLMSARVRPPLEDPSPPAFVTFDYTTMYYFLVFVFLIAVLSVCVGTAEYAFVEKRWAFNVCWFSVGGWNQLRWHLRWFKGQQIHGHTNRRKAHVRRERQVRVWGLLGEPLLDPFHITSWSRQACTQLFDFILRSFQIKGTVPSSALSAAWSLTNDSLASTMLCAFAPCALACLNSSCNCSSVSRCSNSVCSFSLLLFEEQHLAHCTISKWYGEALTDCFFWGVRFLFLLWVAHSLECKVPQATHSSGTTCQTNANFRKYKEGTVNRPRRKVRPPVKQTIMRHQNHFQSFSRLFFWQSPPAAPKFTWLRRVFFLQDRGEPGPVRLQPDRAGLGSTGGSRCRLGRWGRSWLPATLRGSMPAKPKPKRACPHTERPHLTFKETHSSFRRFQK